MGDVKLHTRSNQTDGVAAAVVDAVSSRTGTPVMDLPPLYDTVDPDALNALFAGQDSNARVRFEYAGRTVVVHADQTVDVS